VNILKHKPVTLLAVAHAILGVLAAFELVHWDGGQWAAVEGVFAALGFTAASQVTANVRLDPADVAAAKAKKPPIDEPVDEPDTDDDI
jgi:hypothetical protein